MTDARRVSYGNSAFYFSGGESVVLSSFSYSLRASLVLILSCIAESVILPSGRDSVQDFGLRRTFLFPFLVFWMSGLELGYLVWQIVLKGFSVYWELLQYISHSL